jgi:antitoxin component YwqK of YwqJK toxin-antitoxin module
MTTRITTLIILTFILFGCNKSVDTYYKNGKKNSSITYLDLKDSIPNGPANWWYENGQLEEEVNFINGHQDGIGKHYYNNGQIKEKVSFTNGKENGLREMWYENGQNLEETEYVNGLQNGRHIAWHPNGIKRQEAFYKNGKLNGLSKHGTQTEVLNR